MTRSYKFQRRSITSIRNSALYGRFQSFPDALDPNGNFDTGAQSGFWVNVNAMRNGVDVAQAFVDRRNSNPSTVPRRSVPA